MLNPAEQLCNNGKRVDLANDAPTSRDDMRSRVRRSLIRRRCSPNRLASEPPHLRWTIAKLKASPPFEFENSAVITFGGIPNTVPVGDVGGGGH